jgi:hypothetical protein
MPTVIEMTGRPKGSLPATTRLEQVGFHRLRLYRLYDDDVECIGALNAFQQSWGPRVRQGLRSPDEDCLLDRDDADRVIADLIGQRDAVEYLAALQAVAEALGLRRIPAVGDPKPVLLDYLPSGVAQTHRYVVKLDDAFRAEQAVPALMELGLGREKATALAAAGPPLPTFTSLASFGAGIPNVDISITADANWDPRTELLSSARRRLRRETGLSGRTIDARLQAIADSGGYLLPDTSPRMDRDALWVWWRIRHRWTYPRIADEWLRLHPDEDWDLRPPPDAVPGEHLRHVSLVERAIGRFARKALIDVVTGPGASRSNPGHED